MAAAFIIVGYRSDKNNVAKSDRATPSSDRISPIILPPDIPRSAVESQIHRIQSSQLFAHSENLSRFLQFIVEATLDGQADQIKEYRIGVEVFGRGDTFDPKEDTIVRAQARNLRSKLAAYYESATETRTRF